MQSSGSVTGANPLSGPALYLLIVVCAAIAVLEGFDLQAISIAAPVMMGELGLDRSQTGQVFASGQAGMVLGAIFGGAAGDFFGRRNTLLVGSIVFGLFCLLTPLVNSFETLALVRLMTGVGIGLAMPNLIGMAVENAPEKHRGKTVSIILAGLPAGGMIVALVGTAYLEVWGWRTLFVVGGVLPLVVAPFIFLLPNHKPSRETRAEGRLPWARALFGEGRAMTTVMLWGALFLTALVLYTMVNWLPSLMTERGFDLKVSHLSSAMFSLGGCIGSFSIGFFVDRLGYRKVLPSLYIGVVLGVCGIAFTNTALLILPSAVVLGFFVVGAFYSLNGASPLYYPASARGLGTGTSVGFGRVGSVVGPLVAGYVLQVGIGPLPAGPSSVPAFIIPLSAMACAAVYLVTRRKTESLRVSEQADRALDLALTETRK
jgi:AAHS family 3-hydroxyphenylpropionic acid transporter